MQVMFQANCSTYSLKMYELFKEEENCFLKQCYTTRSLHWRSTANKKTCRVCHWERLTQRYKRFITTSFGFPKNL